MENRGRWKFCQLDFVWFAWRTLGMWCFSLCPICMRSRFGFECVKFGCFFVWCPRVRCRFVVWLGWLFLCVCFVWATLISSLISPEYWIVNIASTPTVSCFSKLNVAVWSFSFNCTFASCCSSFPACAIVALLIFNSIALRVIKFAGDLIPNLGKWTLSYREWFRGNNESVWRG